MSNVAIIIHGGAGTILKSNMTQEKKASYELELRRALDAGYSLLQKGRSAIEAVTSAVITMEECPLFNAGKGSVFNAEGKHEMDASIMEGRNRDAGAVGGVKLVRNPILLARKVLEKSEHVLLFGEGAERFARENKVEFKEEAWFYDAFRFKQWKELEGSSHFQLDHSEDREKKFGTVGAVALDAEGNLAAATSTGGMTNKQFGRVGDSPLIGSGTYAHNLTCAVSCTGDGEFFIRGVAAYDVSCFMEYGGLSLQEASNKVINDRMLQINGAGGLIAVDAKGNMAMPFNTEGMYRACVSSNTEMEIGIFK